MGDFGFHIFENAPVLALLIGGMTWLWFRLLKLEQSVNRMEGYLKGIKDSVNRQHNRID